MRNNDILRPRENTSRAVRRWKRWVTTGLLALSMIPSTLLFAQSSSVKAPRVAQEIRYHMADAEEVFLLWGVNGWRPLPESLRPQGTILKDGVMRTPMVRDGTAFVAKLQVAPAWIDYGFLITKDRVGAQIDVWDREETYVLSADADETVDIKPKFKLWVTLEIHYRQPLAGEALLKWGINGWKTLPEARWLEGTALEDAMRTTTTRHGDTFIARVLVPARTSMNYGFLLTKRHDQTPMTPVWEDHGHLMVGTDDTVVQVAGNDSAGRWRWFFFVAPGFVVIGGWIAVRTLLRRRKTTQVNWSRTKQ